MSPTPPREPPTPPTEPRPEPIDRSTTHDSETVGAATPTIDDVAPGTDAGQTAEDRHDLSSILEQLHEELEIEQAAAPTEADAPLSNPLDIERPRAAAAAAIESTGGIDFDPEFASFGNRFVGFVIDTLVLMLFVAPGIAIMAVGGSGAAIAVGIAVAILGVAIATRLSARSVSSTGQWIGNRVTNTRVVDARNGSMLSPAYAGSRFLVRQFLSTILLLGFLPALFDAQRRTFHDRMVDSIVIRPPRARWVAGSDPDPDPVA